MLDTEQRLIEQWMPVNQVSTEAIRERAAASALPPVNWLHVWWARRPLSASRAVTLLSMLPAQLRWARHARWSIQDTRDKCRYSRSRGTAVLRLSQWRARQGGLQGAQKGILT